MNLTRRDALRLGAAAFALSLPKLLAGRALASDSAAPKARSVIVLYLSGGPSQLDMFDLKPQAPEEIRGTFRPIATSVAGIHICEHLPRMAKLADKYTIIRSMSHEETDHVRATYFAMTGNRVLRRVVQSSTLAREDRPHLGAVVAKLLGPNRNLPPFAMVPEFVAPVGPSRPGQHAGFLGAKFDPYLINSDPNEPGYDPGPLGRALDQSEVRLGEQRSLLTSLEQASPAQLSEEMRQYDVFRAKAFDLMRSPAAQRAFDLSQESAKTRDRYTRTTFGQSALVARRLIEAGVRVVQVNFVRHDNGKGGQGYDSHAAPPNPPHLDWLKNTLLPPTDAAFASLVEDLSDRGLLDETLVLMLGEFGRTPKFNKTGGRDHWSRCYSMVVAGGGLRRGMVYGASDHIAAYPTRDPASVEDLFATVYHQLGIDPHASIHDLTGRPLALVEGQPLRGLMG
ncbi:MAG TPA: DUF1501 domain-containing protein [Gemmataceae bacterium]|jgi:uncharacterized protein (DUF1501 family)|nr:DUF1501 domain-containing protein [Gemmataceae bacterium]